MSHQLTNEKKEQFATIMMKLLRYYQQPIEPLIIEIMWDDLKQYQIADVERAIAMHRKDPDHCDFMPKAGRIIKNIETILGCNAEEKAAKAWSDVVRRISEQGGYATQKFDDPVIHAVIYNLGGWVFLCNSDEKYLELLRKNFCETYKIYSKNPPKFVPDRLPGRFDVDPVRAMPIHEYKSHNKLSVKF